MSQPNRLLVKEKQRETIRILKRKTESLESQVRRIRSGLKKLLTAEKAYEQFPTEFRLQRCTQLRNAFYKSITSESPWDNLLARKDKS